MNLKTPPSSAAGSAAVSVDDDRGLPLPAFAAPAEGEHAEPVVLTVYEQTEGGEAKVVKSYRPSELAALKTTGTVGYQYWKNGEETILAATEYVTIDSLLTDAGLTFSENDTLPGRCGRRLQQQADLRREPVEQVFLHQRQQDRGSRLARSELEHRQGRA